MDTSASGAGPNDDELRRGFEQAMLDYRPKAVARNARTCEHCRATFGTALEAERHRWSCDPKPDPFVEKWRHTDWSTWSGSSFYRDDPYY